jgi:hypothetical protein
METGLVEVSDGASNQTLGMAFGVAYYRTKWHYRWAKASIGVHRSSHILASEYLYGQSRHISQASRQLNVSLFRSNLTYDSYFC